MRAESYGRNERMQHVFVYGTLRAGESNDIRLAAERHGIAAPLLLGSGHINGRVYDFDDYPGLVLDSTAGRVHGDIYRIDETLVPVLDEIEEIVPGVIGLYRSERVFVTLYVDGGGAGIDFPGFP